MLKTIGIWSGVYAVAALIAGHAHAVTLSGTYYEDSGAKTCNNEVVCTLLLTTLPSATTGSFLFLSEVSCKIRAGSVLESLSVAVTDNGLNGRRTHFLTGENRVGTQSIRSPIDFKISGGPPRQIAITAEGADTSILTSLQCTIVGRLEQE